MWRFDKEDLHRRPTLKPSDPIGKILMMPAVSPESLAKEVSSVCTVGLGRPLRSNAKCDQLIKVARQLAADRTFPKLRVLEEALVPSIERLGKGELVTVARIEFGTHPDTQALRFLSDRRQFACNHLGIGNDALGRIERAMHLAIAEDLIKRLEARQKPEQ